MTNDERHLKDILCPFVAILKNLTPFRELNTFLSFSFLLGGTKVYVAGAEFAKEVLVSNNTSFQRPYFLRDMLPFLGTGILTTNGRMHALQRRAFTPALSYSSVKGFLPTFSEKAFELVKVSQASISKCKQSSCQKIAWNLSPLIGNLSIYRLSRTKRPPPI